MKAVVRILLGLALVLSIYLAWKSLSGEVDTIAGCGGGSGCSSVLGSSWAYVFKVIPVSVLGALLYLTGLWASFANKKKMLLVVAGASALGALWFAGLQVFAVRAFCPWCSVIHGCALLAAMFIIVGSVPLPEPNTAKAKAKARKQKEQPLQTPGLDMLKMVAIGMAASVVFALAQVLGPKPDTHQTVEAKSSQGDGIIIGGKFTLRQGSWKFDLKDAPHLGSAKDGVYPVVELFDYTCSSCRQLAAVLDQLEKKHPGKFCVVALPTPLHSNCNSHYPAHFKDHLFACEYAEIALGLFYMAPDKFPEFHHWMMGPKEVPSLEMAKSKAAELLGGLEILEKGIKDPRVSAMIEANVGRFRQLTKKSFKMPKIAVKSGHIDGLTRTPELFIELMEKYTGFAK